RQLRVEVLRLRERGVAGLRDVRGGQKADGGQEGGMETFHARSVCPTAPVRSIESARGYRPSQTVMNPPLVVVAGAEVTGQIQTAQLMPVVDAELQAELASIELPDSAVACTTSLEAVIPAG